MRMVKLLFMKGSQKAKYDVCPKLLLPDLLLFWSAKARFRKYCMGRSVFIRVDTEGLTRDDKRFNLCCLSVSMLRSRAGTSTRTLYLSLVQ